MNAITNPTPKARFQQSGDNITKHRTMVDSREFERATDFGMMQYCTAIAAQIKDGNSAMAAGFKLQGALEFIQTTRMLSETPQAARPMATENLDQEA